MPRPQPLNEMLRSFLSAAMDGERCPGRDFNSDLPRWTAAKSVAASTIWLLRWHACKERAEEGFNFPALIVLV